MKTLLKVILACIIVIAVLIGGAIAYLMFALDPNSYKPQLEEAARQQGVELEIAGELGWSLWPNLAITLGETRFAGEEHGLRPSSLREANLVLSWSDLLHKRIAVKALAIDGADLHLTSLDSGAAIAAAPATGEQPLEATTAEGQTFSLAVDKLTVASSRLRLEQSGSTLLLDNIDFNTSGVSLDGKAFPLALSFRYQPDEGDSLQANIIATASYDQSSEKLGLQDSLIEITGLLPDTLRLALKGTVELATETARFHSLVIDLSDSRLSGDATLNYSDPLALDLVLKGTDLNLDQLLPQDTIAGMTLTNPALRLNARNGVFTLQELSAGLFGGHFNSQATVDTRGNTPTLRFNANLDSIDVATALDHIAEDVDLAGTLAMTLEGTSRGNDGDALLANLLAEGNLQVTGLHLGNINVEQSYCELAALVERKGEREDPWPKGTRLNDLTSDFRMEGPVLHLDDYSTGIGNISLRGNGAIDIDHQTFDVRAITRLDGDRTSAEGCEVKSTRVRDKDIPFVCKDSFADAGAGSCKPDPAFVRNLLQNEILDRLGGEEGEGSLEDRLRGLLGR